MVALLIAGACFGVFYIPITSISALMSYGAQPYDYFYHYRADQDMPDEEAVNALAGEYGLSLKDWGEFDYITLGFGNLADIMEDDGIHWHTEYAPISGEEMAISEETWNRLTGEEVNVLPGTYLCITNTEETSLYINKNARHITNMVTRRQLSTEYAGMLHYDLLSGGGRECRVLDQADYERLAEGLSDDWKGKIVHFNIDGQDSYPFANALFRRLIASAGEDCFTTQNYSRVTAIMAEEQGIQDWQEEETERALMYVNPDEADSIAFRLNWKYKPSAMSSTI